MANEWEIGAENPAKLRAKYVGKTLQVSGLGLMKDFASAQDVPWKDCDIEAVEFGRDVYSIGNNAFGAFSLGQVVLPELVERVGVNAFAKGTQLLAYEAEVTFEDEDADVFFYTESAPVSEDHYWQSDKTSGNILPDDYVSMSRAWYWNEEEEPVIHNPIKVLFIGNSFTYRNGVVEYSGGVPGLFNGIAESLGKDIETYSVTGPGWYLSNHAKSTDACGKQVERVLNLVPDLDYVVLQEQSVNPFENYSSFLSGVQALQQKIQNSQQKAQIYLYETWGSPFSANERKISVPAMEKKLDDAYTNAGKETGLPVSYIGRAFREVYLNHPEIKTLYGTDNRHQGFAGAYLSAATHVASMLGLDVTKATYQGSSKWSEPTLEEGIYATLRETALRAGRGEIPTYDGSAEEPETSSQESGEEETNILRVACWGRFMKEAKFNKLMKAYEDYATSNSIGYESIDAEYYQGATTSDPYYYIANFTAEILVRQPEIDIVLPCADNFNANQSNLAVTALIAIDVYGQTNRRVGRFHDDVLTMSFFDFAQTSEAASIFAEVD